ncbi:putative peptide zinc metalloprotease protein [Paenarthrobacter nitroguajacolicus]|uniref:hypothetical protein n=1 Tax=Paenarthrobacter nitroguajacolicus TaxID=211146 RepID=UPI002866D00F|nr:hypothetical protein [Paenarthrobacter nitroguajacolicus]MDR6988660.1 putative peptide zinc metalloprotease protein [Paenarthrobacter nitroguajacolicus]
MTTASGGSFTQDGPPRSTLPERFSINKDGLPEFPVQADGVQLLGEAEGSGYREPPSLVRRADGQALQLTRLLFLVLEAADGTRSLDDIAHHVTPVFGRQVSAGNVAALVRSQLLPLGLLRLADGSQPEVKRADPLLGMRFRFTVTDPTLTRKLTTPFAVLFHPIIVAVIITAFAAACWWVLMVKGLASATHNAFANPGLLLLVFFITILSAGFHEFGHAAAATRGGAVPGRMGAGLYLAWPAFFTDVTDSYRLGRGGRLRTDLGGLYFNAIAAVAIMAVWLLTHDDAWLLVIATQVLQMVRQLLPLLRFDGYHILADATGVPDLFQRIKPTLLALLPWHRNNAEAQALKPWARALVTVWVLVTVPLLLLSVLLMVISLPRLLGTAWSSAAAQFAALTETAATGDFAGAGGRFLALLAVALPVLAILLVLARVAGQTLKGLWKKTEGKAVQRGVALVLVAAMGAGLAWIWWPHPGNYAPVQPYERGTLLDAAPALETVAGTTALVEGRPGQTVALWPEGQELPTRDNPELSLVMVPRADSAQAAGEAPDPGTVDGGQAAPSWVFPFNKPPAPDDDGNQALAVNTTDGSVVYDVAFALVWANEGQPVETTNEAYAFANCTGCAAVAVGFQVVLIVGQADVVVPQNLSAAANYNCVACVTYALASQLVLTLDGPLSDDGLSKLASLWQEIAEFGRSLRNVPLSEIQARLSTYKERIVEVIRADPSATHTPPTTGPSTAPSPDATTTHSVAPTQSAPPQAPAPASAVPTASVPAAPAVPAPTVSASGSAPAPAPEPTTPTDPVTEPAPTYAPTPVETAGPTAAPGAGS